MSTIEAMSDELPDKITIGDKYGPAMEMTDPKEAHAYFQKCVRHSMRFGHSEMEAIRIERINFGYFAGYYSSETQSRVELLFGSPHPFFGPISRGPSDPETALNIGYSMGHIATGHHPMNCTKGERT